MGKLLTDFTAKNTKPPKIGRLEIFDTGSPGLALRVTSEGHRSFVWRGRIKGRPESIRITIGPALALPLKDAREQARKLYLAALNGDDPREQWRSKAAEAKYDFKTVAETYITEHVSKLRSKAGTEAEIRRYLIEPWGKRSITSITADDVAEVVRGILEDGKPTAARIVLSHAKRLFRWAAAPGRARVKANPAAGLSARKDFDLVTVPRQVALSPEHLALIWKAAEKLPYPAGPYFKMLLLSGQRRSEVSGMKWSELDLDREEVWNIPAERMKAGRPHEVPLSPAMVALLKGLQETRGRGDFVFSTMRGERPIGSFGKLKTILDAKIKELAPDTELPAWRLHDLRRTMRTALGAISSIPQDIRELVISHVPSTLVQTYDRHGYRDEKRQALTLWSDRLSQIVNPTPVGENVVTMRAAQ